MIPCAMENSIKELIESVGEVRLATDGLRSVNLKNGGGRHIIMSRKEFDQMIYDRPKDFTKRVVSSSEKITKVLDLVFKVAMIIFVAAQYIKI